VCVCVCVCDDADGSKLRQNDCQLGRLNAYSHDAIDDNDDLMNRNTNHFRMHYKHYSAKSFSWSENKVTGRAGRVSVSRVSMVMVSDIEGKS